jgi:hypothetical protein
MSHFDVWKTGWSWQLRNVKDWWKLMKTETLYGFYTVNYRREWLFQCLGSSFFWECCDEDS